MRAESGTSHPPVTVTSNTSHPPVTVSPSATSAPRDDSDAGSTVGGNGADFGITMGGAKRKDMGSGLGAYRPEQVHSEVCDTSLSSKVCTACQSTTACWHGVDPAFLEVNVPAGKVGFKYVASIWASCSTPEGYWRIHIEQVQYASLSCYNNGVVVPKTLSDQGDSFDLSSADVGKNAQIKVVLAPSSAGHAAFAKILILAMANKWVDTCMDRNFCLQKLGDGSVAAFELRNSNRRQYDCLLGNAASHLAVVCAVWRACFASQTGTNHEAELLKLLSAVFKAASTSLVKTNLPATISSAQTVGDAPGCTDPAVADPESVECECLDEIKKACADAGVADSEECFLTHMCNHQSVCGSWKTDHCAGGDSLLVSRSHSRSSMTAENTNTLDGSVTGKCTTSTRF